MRLIHIQALRTIRIMHCIRWNILLLGVVLMTAPARAQNESADPKAAAKGLYAAVASGNAAGIEKFLAVENDPAGELVKTYADLIIAGKKLGDAAKAKYPGVAGAFGQGTIVPEDVHLIDTAEATIEGDRASLKLSGRVERIELRKLDGTWKVFIGQAGDTVERRDKQKALLAGWISVMNQTATEISDGQFNTIQDAEAAVKERLGAVLAKALRESGPSSRPATQPAA